MEPPADLELAELDDDNSSAMQDSASYNSEILMEDRQQNSRVLTCLAHSFNLVKRASLIAALFMVAQYFEAQEYETEIAQFQQEQLVTLLRIFATLLVLMMVPLRYMRFRGKACVQFLSQVLTYFCCFQMIYYAKVTVMAETEEQEESEMLSYLYNLVSGVNLFFAIMFLFFVLIITSAVIFILIAEFTGSAYMRRVY